MDEDMETSCGGILDGTINVQEFGLITLNKF
jgi:hypothetical protein